MTAKYDAFIEELDALCKKHNVSVASSLYDSVAIYDDYDAGSVCFICDETNEVGESLNPPPREFENVGNE